MTEEQWKGKKHTLTKCSCFETEVGKKSRESREVENKY